MNRCRIGRRDFLKAAGLTTAGMALGGCRTTEVAGTSENRPNVVVIFTDDQRWDCLGRAPKPLLGMKTPYLDRLADEGALFENMFVTTSLCSPSRASFLSGLYAHSHGVMNNFTDYPVSLASYPRRLQEAGYNTAYIQSPTETFERRPEVVEQMGYDYFSSLEDYDTSGFQQANYFG